MEMKYILNKEVKKSLSTVAYVAYNEAMKVWEFEIPSLGFSSSLERGIIVTPQRLRDRATEITGYLRSVYGLPMEDYDKCNNHKHLRGIVGVNLLQPTSLIGVDIGTRYVYQLSPDGTYERYPRS